MAQQNTVSKAVRDQMRRWASLGGLARKKALTKIQASKIGRKAGIASGIARKAKRG